ncbi:hypothetical protein LJC05_00210 [Bacteroides sp. OttesenSCG-928-J23]|nr:hypothetical protein [Bacteroides sp. OttesenSCG-928-J23]
MKQLIFILISIMLFAMTGCSEDVSIEIPENIEKAEITGITVYNESLAAVTGKVTINSEAASVNVTLKTASDLTRLKVALTVSSGSTVTKPLGTAVQDFSSPRQVTIQSPVRAVQKEWIIEIVNP